MKKKNLMPMAKKTARVALAFSLAAAMAIPTAVPFGSTAAVEAAVAAEDEEVDIPEPFLVYDFEKGIQEIYQNDENASITESAEVYVKKEADQKDVNGKETLDANGLVYTGTGDTARYYKQVVSNQPSTMFDEDRGSTVLKLGQAITIPEIRKTASAAIDGDTGAATTARLDQLVPVSDDAIIQPEVTVYSELKLSNPFAGMDFEDYDEYEDLTVAKGQLKKFGPTIYQPIWTKGVTISYWIKVPVDGDGKYKNSSVLRWELDDQLLYQADDYAKYLTSKKYDIYVENMTDEQKAASNESGVPEDSDFYFEYIRDENGDPIVYTNSKDITGYVYNMESGSYGKYYFCNPNFGKAGPDTPGIYGFELRADGSINPDEMYHKNYYSRFHTLDPAEGSQVKQGYASGEMQIDADNSIFWCIDNGVGKVNNPNVKEHGQTQGFQNSNRFAMNSWRESQTFNDAYRTKGTYDSALFVADSPVSSGNEKNAVTDTWQHVTITMMNDWIEFYMNGEKVDVAESYSTAGLTTLGGKSATDEVFKRLNKGTGLRGGYGCEKTAMGNTSYGNYVCTLFMDWLSNPDAVLTIGGGRDSAANDRDYAEDYNQTMKSSEFAMDELTFYDVVLTDEQIKAAYEETTGRMNREKTPEPTLVDVKDAEDVASGSSDVVADSIKGKSGRVLKVNENKKQADQLGVKLSDNPFAGKTGLEGATIAYWMKQDKREGVNVMQSTVGVAFMDEAKDIYNYKESESAVGQASSILYQKSDGSSQFIEAYSDGSLVSSLKNNYNFTIAEADSTALLTAASEWSYVTMTMTNNGIKVYVNGKEYANNSEAVKAGARFLDGYFTRVSDEASYIKGYGAYGGTNNQGATTIMDFLSYEDTAIYLGYLPQQGGGLYEKTNPAYFHDVRTYDVALTSAEVQKLYDDVSDNPFTEPGPDVKLGDVDGDGDVKLGDAQMALKAALNIITLSTEEFAAADVDEDGDIKLSDAQMILRAALNIITL